MNGRIGRTVGVVLAVLLIVASLPNMANALIATVSGQVIKIAPPPSASTSVLTHPTHVFAWDERQSVTLASPLRVDIVGAGTYDRRRTSSTRPFRPAPSSTATSCTATSRRDRATQLRAGIGDVPDEHRRGHRRQQSTSSTTATSSAHPAPSIPAAAIRAAASSSAARVTSWSCPTCAPCSSATNTVGSVDEDPHRHAPQLAAGRQRARPVRGDRRCRRHAQRHRDRLGR